MAYKMKNGVKLNMTAAERKERGQKAIAARWAKCTDPDERSRVSAAGREAFMANRSEDHFKEMAKLSAAVRRNKAKARKKAR